MGGILLGAGLGGFVDGIVAHQILGWHQMLSSWISNHTLPGMRTNMMADGWFHLGCLALVVVGLFVLYTSRPTGTAGNLAGLLLIGWGTFNLVEGIVDHHLLGVHHVLPGPHEIAYDLGFLALGVGLIAIGIALAREPGSRAPGGPHL